MPIDADIMSMMVDKDEMGKGVPRLEKEKKTPDLLTRFLAIVESSEKARQAGLVQQRAMAEEYLGKIEDIQSERHHLMSQYNQPIKPSTAEYIAAGAGAALPVIGRLVGGRTGRKMRDIGALPAGFVEGSIEERKAGRERALRTGMAGLGRREELAGTRFNVMSGLGEAESGAARQGFADQRAGLMFERDIQKTGFEQDIAERRETRLGLSKPAKPTMFDRMSPEQQKAYLNRQAYGAPPGVTNFDRMDKEQQDAYLDKLAFGAPESEKAPTVGSIKAGLLDTMSPEEQIEKLFPPSELSELNRGNFALKTMDIEEEELFARANQKFQSLPADLQNKIGLKNNAISSIADLERAGTMLASGGIDKPWWFTGDYAVDTTVQGIVADYNELLQRRKGLLKRLSGQGLPGPSGEPTDAELDAELRRRQVGAGP